MAMSKSKNPELASHAFVALQGFLKNPKMKKQFIEDRGIQMLCKMFANRDIPAMEIFDAIQRLLVGFLYEFPDVQDFRLSRREMNELFQSVTQLGGQLTEMSQHQLAVNAYEAALQLDDSNPQLLMAAAVLQVGLDQLDDAADKFRRALERAPGTPIAAYNLAKILVKQHGHSRTAQLEAVELLEACLDSVRSGAPKREFTLPGFQPLKGRDNRRIKLTHPLTSPVFSLLVMMLERQGRYQEALKYAEEWSLWCLNEGRAQIALGRLLYKNGEHDRALDFFSKSMEMDPSNPVFAFMKSMTHFKHHQYEEALELVDTALILDQSQSQTYKRIMERTLAKQRKINKESRKAGVKPERLQLPDMPQSVHDSGLLLKGRILMRMNRTEDALVTLDQVCAQQQDSKETTDPDCTALMLAGNCLMKLNRSAEAEDRFKQAIQVWKAASEALFSSPRMYFMSHPSQDTLLQSLEEFVTAHPDSMSTVGTLLRTSGITSREE
jgi:tetratricopeptide (TPR) repeat protein